ncbi:hypothetical protein HA050_06580 [Iodobacter sp. HSC-16F04]|uniref:4Fe4S-binding SPASM domain-containing protein n=1 Tax=Iodobacter violaceini TaxID=3044271 RepID=A0ABX0KUP5_9NEIS|nr:radical SAM/SPASM domain-containing protein [Iodobacter violacea]NHQ85784.1 hypothetical protein [Iodobacter violacea]
MYVCIKPYVDYAVLPNQDVSVCCSAWHSFGPIGSAMETTIEKIWQSERAQIFRQSVSDGSFKYCHANACPHLKNHDGPVILLQDAPEIIRNIILDNRFDQAPLPKNLHLAFDETCNLRCPSCRNEIIASDQTKVSDIFNMVRADAAKEVEYINLGGAGDVFASPVLRNWLYKFNPAEFPLLRHIHFHTNLQLFSEKVWEKIPDAVKKMKITFDVSMDGASEKTYGINRPPGNWDKLINRLNILASLRKQGIVADVCCNFVVQKNNFHEIPDFISLVNDLGFDMAKFTKLDNWGTFESDDYLQRAVHLPDHPLHKEYLEILKNPLLQHKIAYLANLN